MMMSELNDRDRLQVAAHVYMDFAVHTLTCVEVAAIEEMSERAIIRYIELGMAGYRLRLGACIYDLGRTMEERYDRLDRRDFLLWIDEQMETLASVSGVRPRLYDRRKKSTPGDVDGLVDAMRFDAAWMMLRFETASATIQSLLTR